MGNEEIMREEDAGRPGKGSAKRKSHDLVFRRIDPHRISGDLIFTDCQAGTAMSGIFEILDKEEDGRHDPECHRKRGQTGDSHQACRTADIVDIEDADPDDFAEAQCGNGQIVTVQTQGGKTHKESDDAGRNGPDNKSDDNAITQLDRHDGAHIGPNGKETGMAHGKLTCVSVDHVEARRQDDIDADQHQIKFPERPDDVSKDQSLENGKNDGTDDEDPEIGFS